MSDQPAPPAFDATPLSGGPPPSGFRSLPRWLRIGVIAAVSALAALGISIVVRVAVQTPSIPTGVTAVADLRLGSCLLEPGDLAEYTVVGCGSPHQQQLIAVVDLAFPGVRYTADESLAIYAQLTCDRLLEYRLYLPTDLEKADYVTNAISPPTLEEYDGGDATTLCAVLDDPDRPEVSGASDDLTVDLYRPAP